MKVKEETLKMLLTRISQLEARVVELEAFKSFMYSRGASPVEKG